MITSPRLGKFVFVCAVAACLAGCAATGVRASDGTIAAMKAGETTIEQALAELGPPTTRTKAADGTTTLQYAYTEAKVRAASFVPIVSLFAGGSDVRMSLVILRFSPHGKLIDVTTSESQFGTGVGAAAGNVTPGQLPQPRQ